MPIHDQTYRRYEGKREPRGRAWAVIASAGIQSMIRKRRFLGLLLLAWLPFAVYAVRIYLAATFPQFTALALTRETFREFFAAQSPFVFFITIWVGAGLLANDKRANALQIYLSKPLTRSEYIAGKLTILFAFLLLVTWAPGILLLILQILFAGSLQFVRANLFLFPAITVFSFLQVVLASFTVLAVSSLTKSSRFAAMVYAGVILFTEAIYGVLFAITRDSRLSWISPTASLGQVGNAIFRLPLLYRTPWLLSLATMIGIIAVSLWVLERRVRGVEVVS